MKKTNVDLFKIFISALLFGGVFAIFSQGYAIHIGDRALGYMASKIVYIVILTAALFLIMAVPKIVREKTSNPVFIRGAEGLFGAVAIMAILYVNGSYIPTWAAGAFEGPIQPVIVQLGQLALPLGAIWFLANWLGDSIKAKNKSKNTENNKE